MTEEKEIPGHSNQGVIRKNRFPYGILFWFCILIFSLIPLGLEHGPEPPLADCIPMDSKAVDVLKEMGVINEITQVIKKPLEQLVFMVSSVDTASSAQSFFRSFYRGPIFTILGSPYEVYMWRAMAIDSAKQNKDLWTILQTPGDGVFNIADNDICVLFGESDGAYYAGFIDGIVFIEFLDAYKRKYGEFYWNACNGGKNDFGGYLDQSFSLKKYHYLDDGRLPQIAVNPFNKESSTLHSIKLLNDIAGIKGMAIFNIILSLSMMIYLGARRTWKDYKGRREHYQFVNREVRRGGAEISGQQSNLRDGSEKEVYEK